eukprot:2230824-Amphidinium_carterae.1
MALGSSSMPTSCLLLRCMVAMSCASEKNRLKADRWPKSASAPSTLVHKSVNFASSVLPS